ncbi:MAG: ABC transporter ATP-binding protein [Clostridium sp.]|uniref:ABC transporter ATP-binding protein n=1 Tax=Clostridium sp. TaxID=1506 RepID=UPI003F2A3B95
MSLIELKNVSKVYGTGESEIKALDNISLSIEEGEMVAIIGPSGSGKSTLLNILGFIDVQTMGEYILKGKELKDLNDNKLAEIRNETVGFIFQSFNLLSNQDLVYNVSLPLLYSKNKKNVKERAKKILEEVGIEKKHYEKEVSKLSGGQKQRVAIGRALVNNPEIILADEPTGALDSENSENVLDMLLKINKKGKTVIVVTHDINVAKKCGRIIKVIDGKIIEDN